MSDNPIATWAAIGLLGFGLYQCAKPEESAVVSAPTPSSSASYATEDRAEEAAEEAVAGTTYADQGRPYGCTEDCSGHDAGYEWAQNNDMTDPDDCGGNSQSFVEGCRAYGEAYQEAREEALEEEE